VAGLVAARSLLRRCSVSRRRPYHFLMRCRRGGRFGFLGRTGSQEHYGQPWKHRSENDKFFHSLELIVPRRIRRKLLPQMY
jgi:hypothetical protein